MDALYWICLIAGGVALLAAIFGGGDTDFDADFDLDVDLDADLDLDGDMGAGAGLVDIVSLRTVMLFAAFFGLCGVLLPLAGVGEVMRAIVSGVTGLTIGVVGNWVIKRVGYEHVSSTVTSDDLKGRTAKVLLPFDHTDQGKIALAGKGQRMQVIARSYEGTEESFSVGDEVVVVRMEGSVAEVVKPS